MSDTLRTCRHCGREFLARAGRGLCRACWNDPAVRGRYGVVATFGGNTTTQMRVAAAYRAHPDSGGPPVTPYRVTVENGTTAVHPTAYAAVLALLGELDPAQLQRLKLHGIGAEQLRRVAGLPEPGAVGSKAVHAVPRTTDV